LSVVQASLLSAVPILTSYDIDATEAFYTEKLGFQTRSKYADAGYLILTRDGVSLHFSHVDSGSPATTPTACYLYVQGVDAFYQQALRAGAVHPNSKLGNRAWGMREFAILDGDGNLLRVGETTS
jgi:catechol 2,3-dioxygenase-like lactoylglutathione lyase family enzyme